MDSEKEPDAYRDANETGSNSGPCLHFTTSGGIHRATVEEVVQTTSSGSYTVVHLLCGRTIHVGRNLGRHEESLVPLGFYRVHEGHLVNLAHIVSYARSRNGGSVTLRNGDTAPVSRLRRKDFLQVFNEGAVVM